MSITNGKDTSRSQAFTYDPLNRLTSAWDTSHWGNAYSYDSWGNLLQKNLMSGKPAGENQVVNADAYNHLIGYSYDAAGNMTHDDTNGLKYNYDQENRITGTAAYPYLYDGGGNRVRKVSGSESTTYWYASPGIIAESDASGNFTNYVFWAGARLARNVNGDIKYYVTDHLHSTDMFVEKTGTVLAAQHFYPWGGTVPGVGVSTSNNHYKFTGKERDSESGLDYFGARYYSNGLGRFISADWSATPIPVPYADFGDPQSLNLYTYVRNLPTTQFDADGHCIPHCTDDAVQWVANRTTSDIQISGGAQGAANDAGIGAAKGTGSFTYHSVMDSNPLTGLVDHFVGEPTALQGSNQTQTDAKVVTIVIETVATILFGPKAGAAEGEGAGAGAGARAGESVPKEGIYEGADATAPGRNYVGQSGDIPSRVAQHEASGKFAPGTKVAGGGPRLPRSFPLPLDTPGWAGGRQLHHSFCT